MENVRVIYAIDDDNVPMVEDARYRGRQVR
jgi:hypothetical protein